ncbi:MAG: hypothetical protein SFT68_00790 [Rickettsiaceae bacterium]|nr:hypothetical protein [Rickettsiaceae bacterium]
MINLKFLDEMKAKMLSAQFNPEEYTQDEINILKQHPSIFDSKYCSQEFSAAAREYFGIPAPLEKSEVVRDVAARFDAYTEHFFENLLQKLITELPEENGIYLHEKLKYYYIWCKDEEGLFWIDYIGDFLSLLMDFAGTNESFDKIIYNVGTASSWSNFQERILNNSWGDYKRIESFKQANKEDKILLQKIFAHEKENDFLNIMLAFANADKVKEEFTDWLNSNEGYKDAILEDNLNVIQAASSELSRIVSLDQTYLRQRFGSLGRIFSEEKIARLAELASKYQMHLDIVDQLIQDLSDQVPIEDGIRNLLQLNNRAESDTQLFKLNQKTSGKTLSIHLLTKNDPIGLFVGKMTKCCQFYTGHSSDSAVMPLFTDTYTGLIVIKKGNNIAGCALVWACTDKYGKSGLVLDSIECHQEIEKVIPEFLETLSDMLNNKNINLYVGRGGQTPKLMVESNVSSISGEEAKENMTDAATNLIQLPYASIYDDQSGIKPISETYKPYQDSCYLYQISPGVKLYLGSKKPTEEEVIQESKRELDDLKLSLSTKTDQIGLAAEDIEGIIDVMGDALFNAIISDTVLQRNQDEEQLYMLKAFINLTNQEDFNKMLDIIYYYDPFDNSGALLKTQISEIYNKFNREIGQDSENNNANPNDLINEIKYVLDLLLARISEAKDLKHNQNIQSQASPTHPFYNSNLSLIQLAKIGELFAWGSEIRRSDYFNKDNFLNFSSEERDLIDRVLNKVKIPDSNITHLFPIGNPEPFKHKFLEILSTFEEEITENPYILLSCKFDYSIDYMLHSGLSLGSIIKLISNNFRVKDYTNPCKFSEEEVNYLEAYISKEMSDSDQTMIICYCSEDWFKQKMDQFIQEGKSLIENNNVALLDAKLLQEQDYLIGNDFSENDTDVIGKHLPYSSDQN